MKLRSNIFLLIAILLVIIMAGQWWVFQHYNQAIKKDINETAFVVSRDTASAVVLQQLKFRSRLSNKEIRKEIMEWRSKHPSQSDSNIVIELNTTENRSKPIIKLRGAGLHETITVPQTGITSSFNDIRTKMLSYSALIFVLGLIAAGIIAHRFTRPLTEVAATAEKIGSGELGTIVSEKKESTPEEIQSMINQFNLMSQKLRDLEEKNKKLMAKKQLDDMGEIARGFAHSLRNPLNTLGLAIDELIDEIPDQKKQQEIEKIVSKQLQRMDSWIKKFMMLSYKDEYTHAKINIKDLIKNIIKDVQKNNIKFSLENRDSVKDKWIVMGLKEEVEIIIRTVLENAIEASSNEDEIDVTLKETDLQIEIKIRDYGKGITEKDFDSLFTPQVSQKKNGFGMGLYISKNLATMRYDGDVQLSNVNPKGVEAVITLNKTRS